MGISTTLFLSPFLWSFEVLVRPLCNASDKYHKKPNNFVKLLNLLDNVQLLLVIILNRIIKNKSIKSCIMYKITWRKRNRDTLKNVSPVVFFFYMDSSVLQGYCPLASRRSCSNLKPKEKSLTIRFSRLCKINTQQTTDLSVALKVTWYFKWYPPAVFNTHIVNLA